MALSSSVKTLSQYLQWGAWRFFKAPVLFPHSRGANWSYRLWQRCVFLTSRDLSQILSLLTLFNCLKKMNLPTAQEAANSDTRAGNVMPSDACRWQERAMLGWSLTLRLSRPSPQSQSPRRRSGVSVWHQCANDRLQMHQNTANNSLSQSNFSKLQFWNVYFKWHGGQNKTRFLFVHLRGEKRKEKKTKTKTWIFCPKSQI